LTGQRQSSWGVGWNTGSALMVSGSTNQGLEGLEALKGKGGGKNGDSPRGSGEKENEGGRSFCFYFGVLHTRSSTICGCNKNKERTREMKETGGRGGGEMVISRVAKLQQLPAQVWEKRRGESGRGEKQLRGKSRPSLSASSEYAKTIRVGSSLRVSRKSMKRPGRGRGGKSESF